MFTGCFSSRGERPPGQWVPHARWLDVLQPMYPADLTGHWDAGPYLAVETHRPNTIWDHEVKTVPLVKGRLTVSFWGRLDNRGDLIDQLQPEAPKPDQVTDVSLIAAGWERWGQELPEHLRGDFVFAIFDREAQELFLARDALGVKPIYYWDSPNGFLFSTSVPPLLCLPQMQPTPDQDWAACYVMRKSMSKDATAYKEIFKLPAGYALSLKPGADPAIRQWRPDWRDDAVFTTRRDKAWVDAYRAELDRSVLERMPSAYPLGVENSGGVDSATLVAFLSHFSEQPEEQLFSFGTAMSKEEPAYILETSQAAQIAHNYIRTGHPPVDIKETQRQILRTLGYPEEHGNGSGHIPFYELCHQFGIRTLFSGFGGDEVVTNYGLKVQEDCLNNKAWGALWGVQRGKPIMQTGRWIKRLAFGMKGTGYHERLRPATLRRWPFMPFRKDWAAEKALEARYKADADYDEPYTSVNDWVINGMLEMDYVPTRLENCTLMAESYGVDYRWPLLDPHLIQQYLSTPALEKLGPTGMGRYLHRRAIDDLVPKRVAWKRGKYMGPIMGGGGLSITEQQRKTVAEDARAMLESLPLMIEEFIDPEKLGGLIHQVEAGTLNEDEFRTVRRSIGSLQSLSAWVGGNH